MMTVFAANSSSEVFTRNGFAHRSTAVTLPWMIVAPNFSAWARISAIKSGPMMPSRCPGKFSTIVVIINCPPASIPSMTSGLRLARAEYSAAVRPAGPEPMMMTFFVEDIGGDRAVGELVTHSPTHQSSDVFVDDPLEDVFLREPDDRFNDLPALEQQ